MALKTLYARLVLLLIQPALKLQNTKAPTEIDVTEMSSWAAYRSVTPLESETAHSTIDPYLVNKTVIDEIDAHMAKKIHAGRGNFSRALRGYRPADRSGSI